MVKSVWRQSENVSFLNWKIKRFYFSDGVLFLPFSHPLLAELNNYNWNFGKHLKKWYSKKDKMLKHENKGVLKNEDLRILRAILRQPQRFYKIEENKKIQQNNFSKTIQIMGKSCLLNSLWLWRCLETSSYHRTN